MPATTPRFKTFVAAALLGALLPLTEAKADATVDRLSAIAAGEHRSPENKARDQYRHPVETLAFFGIREDMTVVELWPFGGWYTEILAPFLREKGKLYAAAIDPDTKNERELGYNVRLKALLDKHPELYDKVAVTALAPGSKEIAPAGSADMVLTFRNIHNWDFAKTTEAVFAEAFRALKPGGILGVVEHRGDPAKPRERQIGYVMEADAIARIESVGFKLVEKSEVNANPKDIKDYERGVWTLPPALALGEKDRETYIAIGESDRFTLKFVKPAE